jgi:hypothetical protein
VTARSLSARIAVAERRDRIEALLRELKNRPDKVRELHR